MDVVEDFETVVAGPCGDALETDEDCLPLFRDLGLSAPKAVASFFFVVLFIRSSSPTIVDKGREESVLRREALRVADEWR